MRTGNNVRQRADGRFEARYAKGRDGRGRVIYGCCYGRTYEEAVRKREEAIRRSASVRELNLLILGAGSHGQEVQEIARALRIFRKTAFLDDAKPNTLGPWRDLERYREEYPIAIPAVGDQALRMHWLGELARAGFVLPVLIHPGAVVSPSAEIGYGTVICAQAVVGNGAVIGKGCIISSSATIDRDAVLPDGTHVICGAVITSGG